jgi:TPR repeat protein
MNKSLAAHYLELSTDQGIAQAQFLYDLILDDGDGIAVQKSLATQDVNYAEDHRSTNAQIRLGISQAVGDMAEASPPLSGAPLINVESQPPDRIDEEDAVVELEKGLRLRDGRGLSHLKNAADKGLSIAKLHYHLRLDELTSDL